MASSFVPGSSFEAPTTEVELYISCRSLPKMDLLSMSDPMVVTFVRPFGETQLKEYHRTEVINNCHDPNFASKIHILYKFEEQQLLQFRVYDVDSESKKLSDHDFIGMASCTLGQIVSCGKVKLPLTRKNADDSLGINYGFIIITAEELSTVKDEVTLKFSGHKLDKKACFSWGWCDPFLEIYKLTDSQEYLLVHKTEVKKWTSYPEWRPFKIAVRSLCNGDNDRKLKIMCYDWNFSGHHSFIGEFYTTLNTLREGPGEFNCYSCINPQKQDSEGSSYENSGIVRLDYYELQPVYSFLEYIKGGTKLHCTIAIDFTGSNGNPQSPDSLHYVSPGSFNSYEQAILEVGSIIEDYDSDKLFPVLGFGARVPPDGKVSHEFYVNLNLTNPFCEGVKGVLDAYHKCIRQVQLYGPTFFAPVIKHVANFATSYKNKDGSDYFILLILTDGVIDDMKQTSQAIIDASVLPLSIIIIGIGNADFSAMEILDGDTVALSSGNRQVARDIVQFVPFNKFQTGADSYIARQRLAKEVLAEIPTQFIGYMKANNITPRPPVQNEVVLPVDPEHLNI
ncbi:copine-8-like [Lycorma delicatula]|uniref:copine-8-like n=1 Tax=Lycorma delicatula TaxID=130591 RepID=UPI003F50F991